MHHDNTPHAAAPRAAARRPAQALAMLILLAALALGYRQACAPAAPRLAIEGDGPGLIASLLPPLALFERFGHGY
ncbi:hypothetical protein D7S47_23005 [Ralstonia pickettii]|jgi:hypothetical protein|nr:hypothetical protein [Ralstonia pickettii]MBA9854242.1 hypothetical protein [Ralstonia pickettii]MBA9920901.1 hypothetical protein [Ralstonia pickettii]MBA9960726.1 hypothetical protein [Ralstonia pickettii]MBB0031782.1 hypothetical protein [Ralstonia pickettii]